MNLLIVSMDSVRRDFGPLLATEICTPRFIAQARDFAVFDRCFTVASATRPVHASLFTGVYPVEHGVLGQRSPRMRPGLAEFLTTLVHRGWAVTGLSEAPTVFTGLPFFHLLQQLDPRPQAGLEQARRARSMHGTGSQALFVHYWSAHTPYGAPDGQAFGEVAQLLAQGRVAEVKKRYARAVTELFEAKLAPLLAELDRDQWTIVICSDHGESWTPEEPYHGQTLRNAVLRVPLYLHLPGKAPAETHDLVSLIDVLPTLLEALGIPFANRLAGHSLLHPRPERHCLAQITPVSGSDIPTAEPSASRGSAVAEPLWSIFDADHKLTVHLHSGQRQLEHTFTELPVDDPATAAHLYSAYHAMVAQSPYVPDGSVAQAPDVDTLLDQRLRDLGYLA